MASLGASLRRWLVPAVSGWCLTFELNPTRGFVVFFCLGTFLRNGGLSLLKLHDAPIQKEYERCSDATTSVEFDWDLRIWEYRGMFFKALEWWRWIIDKSELASQLFVISNLYQQHGHIYVITYWYTLYLPFLCFKQEPIHTICFKNTLLATEHCRSCQHHLGSQGFEICTSFYAGSSRALENFERATFGGDYSNMVEQMYWCSGSDISLSVVLVGGHSSIFSGTIHYSLFEQDMRYVRFPEGWLYIQLLQQLSTCTHGCRHLFHSDMVSGSSSNSGSHLSCVWLWILNHLNSQGFLV